MRVISEPQSSEQLVSLLKSFGGDTLLIEREGELEAVVISPARYQEIRKLQNEEFRRVCNEISDQAQANGLTEEILNEILAEAKAERAARA